MISTKMVYELVDMRRPGAHVVLAPAVMLRQTTGELHVWAANARGYVFELPEDDDTDQIEFDRERDQIVIHTSDGSMVLLPLTLDRYEQNVRPFIGGPMLRTTKDVQRYWSDAIRNAE